MSREDIMDLTFNYLKGPVDNFFALMYQYNVNVDCTV